MVIGCMALWLQGGINAQNSLSLSAGYLFTHTSIPEYKRPDLHYYLLDVVSIDPDRSSFHAAFSADIDLGSRFFLSTGMHYQQMGLSRITFTDTLQVTYSYSAIQNYLGWSLLLKYHYVFRNSRIGLFAAAGPKMDFAIGYLNLAEQAPFRARDAMTPFARFNPVALAVAMELGGTCRLGPGMLFARINYFQGVSDALRDDYLVGKTLSAGLDLGYSLFLPLQSGHAHLKN